MTGITDPLCPRRRRLLFRATHRGTKEADLMIGGFVRRNVAGLSDQDVLELEGILDLPDVDLADWLTGRVATPPWPVTPLLARMAEACRATGAGQDLT